MAGDLVQSVKDFAAATPLAKIATELGKGGQSVLDAVDEVKRRVKPYLPGSTPPAPVRRRTTDINLPAEHKRRPQGRTVSGRR